MFTSPVIKVRNVHPELKQCDLSQIFTQRASYMLSGQNVNNFMLEQLIPVLHC